MPEAAARAGVTNEITATASGAASFAARQKNPPIYLSPAPRLVERITGAHAANGLAAIPSVSRVD